MARTFPEVYYYWVVPWQQLLNKPLHYVPFQSKRLPLHICILSRQFLMNCTFIFAHIINSKLVLFSTRFAEKLVLNGCFEYELWGWFPFNMRRLVAKLNTRTRTGSKTSLASWSKLRVFKSFTFITEWEMLLIPFISPFPLTKVSVRDRDRIRT